MNLMSKNEVLLIWGRKDIDMFFNFAIDHPKYSNEIGERHYKDHKLKGLHELLCIH